MPDPTPDPFSDLLDRRLVVCVGPGGVGKTTTAAALALRAAGAGRRTLVLTIDPAKRLADALGLTLDRSRDAASSVTEHLDAAMLDTKASFDALITRLTDAESRDAIFDNRVYQAFSRTLARSHAYVAAERLHDALDEDYDLIVLDTPPTRSALDILDAPARLSAFLDESVLRWLLDRERDTGGLSFARLASLGGAAATRLLGRLAGDDIVQELVEFLRVLSHLRDGFEARADRVRRTLADPSTAYVLVAAPSQASLEDATHLGAQLADRLVPAHTILMNRAFVAFDGAPVTHGSGATPPGADGALLAALREEVADGNDAAFEMARVFRDEVAPTAELWALPERAEDIRDLAGLERLLEHPLPL